MILAPLWETSPSQAEWDMMLMKAAEIQKEKKDKDIRQDG